MLVLCPLLGAQVNLAIIPFDAKGLSDIEVSILIEQLEIELSKTGQFAILGQQEMDLILANEYLYLTSHSSEAMLAEAGRLLRVERLVTGIVAKVGNGYSAVFWLINVGDGTIIQMTTNTPPGTLAQLWSPGMNVVARTLAGQSLQPEKPSLSMAESSMSVTTRQTSRSNLQRQPVKQRKPRRIRKGDLYVFPRLGVGRSGWGDVPSIGGQFGYGSFLGGKVFGDVLVMYDHLNKIVNSINVVALYELKVWIFFGQGGIGYIEDQRAGGIGIRAGGGIEIPIGENFRLRPALEINYGSKEGQPSYALNLLVGWKMPGGQ